uniref:Uncharacterized protein n=1 Tax=Strigops habroptila TaxID=2489341 RepID=A0A672U7P3_STRHB
VTTVHMATLLTGPGGKRALSSNNLRLSAVACCCHLNRNLTLRFCHRFPIDLPGKQTEESDRKMW